ncbi:DUF4339 domain-containing protein [Paludisphaera sp.]|uniref:DUF4339 domain-containing protein n=1 Tax=Paludisphaera sp. TaxID=2017432 RepID=UPI00301DB710
MSILVICECGKNLRAKDEAAGKKVKCPYCGSILCVHAPRSVESKCQPPDVGPSVEIASQSTGIENCDAGRQAGSGPPPLPLLEWYCAIGHKRQGPMTLSTLQNLIERGEVGPADLVWQAGTPDWRPVSCIDCLLDSLKIGPNERVPENESAVNAPTLLGKGLASNGPGSSSAIDSRGDVALLAVFAVFVFVVISMFFVRLSPDVDHSIESSAVLSSSEEVKSGGSFDMVSQPVISTSSEYIQSAEDDEEDEEKDATERLKKFAREIHSRIKASADGHRLQHAEKISSSTLEYTMVITVDDNFDYDVLKSDSVLSPFKAEIYIGYSVETTMETSGLARELIPAAKRNAKQKPRIVKCNYKAGYWALVDDSVLYNARAFLALPAREY